MKDLMISIALGLALSTFNVQADDADVTSASVNAEQFSVATAVPNLLQQSVDAYQDGDKESTTDGTAASDNNSAAKEYETPISDYSNGGYF